MPKKKKAKLLVLDTNVILNASSCIHHFEENDVVIPITVLEELDNFKRGNELINFNARDFLRDLDEITGDHLFKSGELLGLQLITAHNIYFMNQLMKLIRTAIENDSLDIAEKEWFS